MLRVKFCVLLRSMCSTNLSLARILRSSVALSSTRLLSFRSLHSYLIFCYLHNPFLLFCFFTFLSTNCRLAIFVCAYPQVYRGPFKDGAPTGLPNRSLPESRPDTRSESRDPLSTGRRGNSQSASRGRSNDDDGDDDDDNSRGRSGGPVSLADRARAADTPTPPRQHSSESSSPPIPAANEGDSSSTSVTSDAAASGGGSSVGGSAPESSMKGPDSPSVVTNTSSGGDGAVDGGNSSSPTSSKTTKKSSVVGYLSKLGSKKKGSSPRANSGVPAAASDGRQSPREDSDPKPGAVEKKDKRTYKGLFGKSKK